MSRREFDKPDGGFFANNRARRCTHWPPACPSPLRPVEPRFSGILSDIPVALRYPEIPRWWRQAWLSSRRYSNFNWTLLGFHMDVGSPDLIFENVPSVDENPRPGRFRLAGSANLMTVPTGVPSVHCLKPSSCRRFSSSRAGLARDSLSRITVTRSRTMSASSSKIWSEEPPVSR